MPRGKENMTASQLANVENHKWQKGQSGNPKGRPKSPVKELMKQFTTQKRIRQIADLTNAEINDIERKLLTLTISELTALAKNESTNAYIKTMALAIVTDMKNGKSDTIDKLRERQYGKTAQRIELTGKDGAPIQTQRSLTQTEAKDFLKELEDNN